MPEIVYIKAEVLRKNIRNIELYGEDVDQEFVARVRKHGIIRPLLLARDGITVIGGHRRLQAAKIIGLKEVPCITTEVPADTQHPDFMEAALLDNDNREKTVEMKAREVEWWNEIETKRAAERVAETQAQPGEKIGTRKACPNLTKPSGRAMDKAAERVGMKRSTAEKAIKVVHKIDELAAAGEEEKATELRETLNNKSVSAALKKAEGSWDSGDSEPETTPRSSVAAYFDGKGKKSPAVKKTHFDDSMFEKLIGPVCRFVQSRAEVLNCVNGGHHRKMKALMNDYLAAFEEWQKARPA